MRSRTLGLTAALFVGLAGCGQTHTQSISPLQTYDGMRSDLAWTTLQSARVAGDVQELNVRVRSGNVGGARQASIRLKLDSLAFAQGAGRCGNEVLRLSAIRPPDAADAYLKDQSRSLSAD